MHSTSHQTMRRRSLRTQEGCIRIPRQGRPAERQTWQREQGVR